MPVLLMIVAIVLTLSLGVTDRPAEGEATQGLSSHAGELVSPTASDKTKPVDVTMETNEDRSAAGDQTAGQANRYRHSPFTSER